MSQADWPWGQCTYWVAGFFNIPTGAGFGDAKTWITGARANGWGIATSPSVGSIAVWQPGEGGAESAGHVAIVTDVTGNVFTVSEMNYLRGVGQSDSRDVQFVPGTVSFIIPPASAQLPSLSGLLGGKTPTALPVGLQVGDSNTPTPPGGNAPLVGGAIAALIWAGEVFLGAVVVIIGIWMAAKEKPPPVVQGARVAVMRGTGARTASTRAASRERELAAAHRQSVSDVNAGQRRLARGRERQRRAFTPPADDERYARVRPRASDVPF